MKLNNKGFALTSIIYMLIVLFLMIMLLVLSNLATRKVVLDKVKYDVKNKLDQGVLVDAAQLPYQNETTGIYYETLELALNKAKTMEKIKVLKNIKDTSYPILDAGKEVVIDVAGNELTLEHEIVNNGTMDIYTSVDGGIINNSYRITIRNTGVFTTNKTDDSKTLSIINTSYTTDSTRIILNENQVTLNKNTTLEIKNEAPEGNTENRYIAVNTGTSECTITVNGANLYNRRVETKNFNLGISNSTISEKGKIVFNSGTIETNSHAIWNNGSTLSTIENPAIEIHGGTIKSTSTYTLRSRIEGSMIYITGGKIESDEDYTLYIASNLVMTGGTIETAKNTAIGNTGANMKMTFGTPGASDDALIIKGRIYGNNASIGELTVNSGTIDGKTSQGIYHRGKVTINGGNISSTKTYAVINNHATEKITINGGTMTSPSLTVTTTNATGGEIEINNGTITSTASSAVNNVKGKTTIKGNPVIVGGTRGINVEAGTATILSGTIEATTGVGVYATTGNITIGTDNGVKPSTTVPSIKGKTYGVQSTSGTTNFYGGKIVGTNGNDSALSGTVTTANGTEVTRQLSGTTETATLKPIFVASGAQSVLDASNHGSGNTWTSVYGSDATVNNGTWGTNYLTLNGTNAWVNMGKQDSNYQSVELTFSVNQMPTGTQYIIGNLEVGGVGLYLTSAGKMGAYFYIDEFATYKHSSSSNTTVTTGNIYHVVSTFDGAHIKLYVNGELEKNVAVSGNIRLTQSNTVMAVGTNPGGSSPTSPYLNGNIYSAAAYDRALTAEEVYQNYAAAMYIAGQPVN